MREKKRVGILILISLMVWSCVPQRRITYVQNQEEGSLSEEANMYFIEEELETTINIGDELYVKVTSADENSTAFNETSNAQVYDPTVISYTVDENGRIKLPYIKSVKIEGLTILQASDFIEEELSQFLYLPSVFIKYVNNKITILGEVNQPGVYVFNYKTVNILQALGYAKDISIFGDKKKVMIIREEGDYRSKHEVDLTSNDLLSSPYYMLQTNDIIYVDPLKRKKWAMSEVPYSLILSIVSLSIVVMTFMATFYN